MSANVLPFSQSPNPTEDTPRPVNYRPSVSYLRLNIVDDAYQHIGYRPGTIFIVQAEKIVDRSLHWVERGGEGFLAYLQDELTSFHIAPLDGQTPPGRYGRLELDYIGAVVEAYPHGITGPRWILGSNEPQEMLLPLFEAVAK